MQQEASLSQRSSFSKGRKSEGRGMLGLKQQDLYHLESNLCQLCLQVKRSNLTARVSTWGSGHVQGGVACFRVCVLHERARYAPGVCASILVGTWAGLGAQWCCAGVASSCQNACKIYNPFTLYNSTTMSPSLKTAQTRENFPPTFFTLIIITLWNDI